MTTTAQSENKPKLMVQNISCIIPQSQSMGGLYVGNTYGAQNADVLKQYGIRAVLTTSIQTPVNYDPISIPFHMKIQAHDKQNYEILNHLQECMNFIHKYRQVTNVYVHCYAGVSRSVTIVVAYIMKYWGWNVENSISFVQAKRVVAKPNQGFMEQLKKFQKTQNQIKQQIRPISNNNMIKNGQYPKPQSVKNLTITPPHHHLPYSTLHKLVPSEKTINQNTNMNMNTNMNINININTNMNNTQGNIPSNTNLQLQRQYSQNNQIQKQQNQISGLNIAPSTPTYNPSNNINGIRKADTKRHSQTPIPKILTNLHQRNQQQQRQRQQFKSPTSAGFYHSNSMNHAKMIPQNHLVAANNPMYNTNNTNNMNNINNMNNMNNLNNVKSTKALIRPKDLPGYKG